MCMLHPDFPAESLSRMLLGFVLFLVLVVLITITFFYRSRLHLRLQLDTSNTDELSTNAQEYSKAVILYSKDGPYTLKRDWPRPRISPKEILVRNKAVGLNPIDWKCVTYGFGIHALPWISGREAAGIVQEVGVEVHGFRPGDRVWVASTNYRDNRTSTFQEVCLASDHTLFISNNDIDELRFVHSILLHCRSMLGGCLTGFPSAQGLP